MTDNSTSRCSWHIHLGAHKTATTHIQDDLAARADEIMSHGAFYLPHGETRTLLRFADVKRPLGARVRKRLGLSGPGLTPRAQQQFARACADHLEHSITARAGDAERIVLSEEDLLGLTSDVFTGDYFRGHARLTLLEALAARAPVHLFLAIRSLETFLPSAYAQALRAIPAETLKFEPEIAAMVQNPPSWAGLVEAICTRIPQAQVTVWNYADYAGNALAIQSAITGCPLQGAAAQARPNRTRSPSAQGIVLAEQVPERDWKLRHALVDQIYAEHPASGGDTVYRPLDAHACEAFRAAFAQDLVRLEAMPRVQVRQFAAA